MALVNCRVCEEQVSADARSCPHCGAPNPELAEFWSNRLFWIIGPIVLVVVLIGISQKWW